jgi:UDP-2-acetamido-2,6-beta-L-arabino-hexul-4-ose reductase
MSKVGITGQNGFIGSHLFNSLRLFKNEFELIIFEKSFFDNCEKLQDFVNKCDVIVHLAALNRHEDANVLYDTNILLVEKLIRALNQKKGKTHVIFSSSTQEEKDNLYGKSKINCRDLLINWSLTSGEIFTGLLIPNVFGPFGKPNYNSVVATFCYKLLNNENPKIDIDASLNLIYVGDLINIIIDKIRKAESNHKNIVDGNYNITVSELLKKLVYFKESYIEKGIIPQLENIFDINLFNTFRSYIDLNNFFPRKYIKHIDYRGCFVEVIKLGVGGQISFSTTDPGITRGNHFHTRKIERFSVIQGKALIQMRRIGNDKIHDFYLNAEEPAYVDMPIWYTHNIKNIGDDILYTIFWINEFYEENNSDTYFENV